MARQAAGVVLTPAMPRGVIPAAAVTLAAVVTATAAITKAVAGTAVADQRPWAA